MSEEQKEKAMYINADVVLSIRQVINKNRIPLYYISSDAVFDGIQNNSPYSETEIPSPISHYGKTKAQGEKNTLENSSQNGVIRISLPYTYRIFAKKDVFRFYSR